VKEHFVQINKATLSGRGLQNDQDWKDIYRRRRDAGENQTPELAYPLNLEVNRHVS